MEFSFESLALVVFVIALGAYLVWAEAKAAGRRVQVIADRRKLDQEEEQATIDAAARRRMIYEIDHYNESASMEPLAHGRVGGIDPAIAVALVGARGQQAANAYQSDDYKRRMNARIQNQRKEEQIFEPQKTAQEAAVHDLMIYGTGVIQTSSSGETRHVPREEYFSGSGGSFDGGGASRDWGGSSSSSSSSSDCSSSSSDSGGSCGGSSD